MEQITLGQALVTQVIIESNIIVISQSDGFIHIINPADETPKVLQNGSGIWALAFSNTYLASGDTAGRLRTWDLTTGYDLANVYKTELTN